MDTIRKLVLVKEIMHDAIISGIDGGNHFDGAKEYIDEVIESISEKHIPLTEAIISKLGFYKDDLDYNISIDDDKTLSCRFVEGRGELHVWLHSERAESEVYIKTVKSVNKLQSLYYELADRKLSML